MPGAAARVERRDFGNSGIEQAIDLG